MSRPRQPGDLVVDIYRDFRRLESGGGYVELEAKPAWLASGSWKGTWPREMGAGPIWAGLALTRPQDLDVAHYQVVVRVPDDDRVLTSLLVSGDIDVDIGYAEGEARDTVAVYGHTYTHLLAGVPITPDPAVDAPEGAVGQWANALDTRTGPAEDVLVGFLAQHVGPAAPLTRRRFPFLNIPESQHRGSTVTYGQRFPTALAAARAICEQGGITCRLEQGAEGVVDVVITEQQLRDDIAFSRAARTLAGLRVRHTTAAATSALVGGPGEEIDRVFTRVTATPPAGGWAYLREPFVSATSDGTLAALQQAGRSEQLELNPPLAVSLYPRPSARWVPGVDFDLGDRLPVTEADTTVEARVEEIVISHRRGAAPTLLPQIGQPIGQKLTSKINRIARSLRRITTR